MKEKTPPNGLIYFKKNPAKILIKNKEWMDVVTRTSQSILWLYVPNMRHGAALFSSIVKVNVACEQAPSEGGKKIRRSKAWFRERSEWESEGESASEASGTRTPSSPDHSRLVPLTL